MEKGREMRTGGTRRVSPPSKRLPKASPGHKLIFALNAVEVDLPERPTREKLRVSGLLGRTSSSNEESEMGGGSDGDEELRPALLNISSSRKFKLNGKALDECNAVETASVPRKLRSAMNKRNRESISPPLASSKTHHHVSSETDWPQRSDAKKSKRTPKPESRERSPKRVLLTSITKDEEEVVEALYALGTILPCEKSTKSKGGHKPLAAKSSSNETRQSLPLPSEASKEDTAELPALSVAKITDLASAREELLSCRVKMEPERDLSASEHPTALESSKVNLDWSGNFQNDTERVPSLSEKELKESAQINACINFLNPMRVPSDSYPGNRSLQSIAAEALHDEKPDSRSLQILDASTTQTEGPTVDMKAESCRIIARVGGQGQDLWPALSSRTCDNQGPSNRPLWLDSGSCSIKPLSTGDILMEKLPAAPIHKWPSWKRCATHVYISRLIHGYQSSEKKSRWSLQVPSSQSTGKEGTKKDPAASIAGLSSLKNGGNSVVSSATNVLSVEKNIQEARLGILHDNRFLQDQQAASSSTSYGLQKPKCDFLSLLPGCGAGVDPSAPNQIPYLQSLVQHHPRLPILPFSLPHVRYSSSFPDQVTATTAQQLHLPQYMANHCYGLQLGNSGSTTKQQQQLQQNQLWAAQMAQFTPSTSISSADLPKWQNGRPQVSPVIPLLPPSVDALGGAMKYSTNQQQFFTNIPSPTTTRSKRPLHHHSSYDDSSAGFRSDASARLQLLCNAQQM